MAKEIKDIKKELSSYEKEFGFVQEIECSPEEQKKFDQMFLDHEELPPDIIWYEINYSKVFFRVHREIVTEEEKQKYLQYKQLSYIKTIRNCVLFFTALMIIAIIVAFILP